jgi:hypothetical protein
MYIKAFIIKYQYKEYKLLSYKIHLNNELKFSLLCRAEISYINTINGIRVLY